MNRLRPDLPPLPARMRKLPVSEAGYPVPWFVTWIKSAPEFRVITAEKIVIAHRRRLCWICGSPLSAVGAFVLGPMCAVNRVNSEPPNHPDCARFAAQACPFLTTPARKRREEGLPEGHGDLPGFVIKRNPGACAVWATKSWHTFDVDDGSLFKVGDPLFVEWYAEGRPATYDEVKASIDSGLPILQQAAAIDGRGALGELRELYERALTLLPRPVEVCPS